jgi:hypothetical protein
MPDITLQELRDFSETSSSLITVDAPLFGVVMILHGRVLERGSHEAQKVGTSIGFPPLEQIVAEASRFWVQTDDCVRARKTREQMSKMLRGHQRAAGSS